MDGETRAGFYDGATARRRHVTLALDTDAVMISEAGAPLARWPYAEIRRIEGPPGLLRLRCGSAPELARLELADGPHAVEVARRCPRLDEQERAAGRAVPKIVAVSLAAAASIILTVVYLVPLAADRLAPLIPLGAERRLGQAVDSQVRELFGARACAGAPGRWALDRLVARLAARAALPMEVEVAVLPSQVPNAFALPGGRIYLLDGLLQRAENADEVGAVLAHEMGHVAGRDGLRKLIQTGGSSFLLGLLFGDISGSGALVLVGQVLVDSAYSRDAERAADRFAADLMTGVGRPAEPLGIFLLRITGEKASSLPFLQSHPMSEERMAALATRRPAATGAPLLDEEEWRSLKAICKAK
ncbi:M48 family metallopeptidase [Chelatococcus sp. SYSU_G07232]|uniref:M48 family metallopeptidase n=1 Tax=Chelatococcus albus TaxID=3047466 RepID=A0ABT7AEC7_9HYPH|nr:M48 family metallopeptidase [Chelatococcus sp. SYSU_G07232]MDJ1157729.1 M48 family metallopeptidase [Chelatococcus sp. SYSU_G07232]